MAMLGIREQLSQSAIKRESSIMGMDEEARNDFFQAKLSKMKPDKGIPHLTAMNRISSAAEVPLGRFSAAGFKRFPEDLCTTGTETVK